MKRVLSGIKPTGEVHLGNWLGAMQRWADSQADGIQSFYFIPNSHALTVRPDPEALRRYTLNAVAWLLVMGVDPKCSVIFAQSEVPAHAELAWILNNYVTMGELNRMTEFKDKSRRQGPEGQVVGLFDYPVLMAADILLYDIDEVPVGEDQTQHIELARDIATRFNNIHGKTFTVPKATVQVVGARIKDLQNPERKMEKSAEDYSGLVFMADSIDAIRAKITRAVTDSGKEIKAGEDKPELTNLLEIYSLVSGQTIKQLERRYSGKGYGEFKQDLAALVATKISELQVKFEQTTRDESRLLGILKQGSEQANQIANAKIVEVKSKIGLL